MGLLRDLILGRWVSDVRDDLQLGKVEGEWHLQIGEQFKGSY
jgi:hypothetical protein